MFPGTAVAGVVVALAALLPAAYLVVRASEAGAAGVAEVLTAGRTAQLLVRTTLLAVAVTASAVAIAVPLAWLTVCSDLPGRRVWVVLTALPLAIPTYVGGFAFVAALGPRGLVQGWLQPLGVERLPSIYGFTGAWLVLTLFTYPYVLLTVRAALRRLDPSLEEASRTLGRSRRSTFRRVTLPQLRPAITAGALLVALYSLSDFGAVSLLRFDSFTRVIFVQYRASLDRTTAAVLGLVLICLTALVLAAEHRTRGRASYHRLHAGGLRRAAPVALGRWRWPSLLACGTLVGIALVLPLGVVVYWLVRGLAAGEPMSLTSALAANSLSVSALGAVAATVAAWPVAASAVRHPGRLSSLVEKASFTGYALPGVVVALSLVFFGARVVTPIYQTRTLLVFAYVVLFLPQAVGAIRSSLLQVNPSLEDASRLLGRSRPATTRAVVLPLVRPGVAAGVALVFLTCMKELPATLLLAPTGFDTLATRVWSATSEAFFGRAAAPALALVLLSALPMGLLVIHEADREPAVAPPQPPGGPDAPRAREPTDASPLLAPAS
ncbi:MAG: iron ABC transporter permease [Actinobacteria bacterium]|nr:iron ABC transporter permease [Actinomycetota bacterium]